MGIPKEHPIKKLDVMSDDETINNDQNGFVDVEKLAKRIITLQDENVAISKQIKLLNANYQQITHYNQVLGAEIDKINAEITELEEDLHSNNKKCKKINNQTKLLMCEADKYKKIIERDRKIRSHKKKLNDTEAILVRSRDAVGKLKAELDDPNYPNTKTALQLMKDKIHYLYLKNYELHNQIDCMRQLINKNNPTVEAKEALLDMQEISALQKEYLEMKLYQNTINNKIDDSQLEEDNFADDEGYDESDIPSENERHRKRIDYSQISDIDNPNHHAKSTQVGENQGSEEMFDSEEFFNIFSLRPKSALIPKRNHEQGSNDKFNFQEHDETKPISSNVMSLNTLLDEEENYKNKLKDVEDQEEKSFNKSSANGAQSIQIDKDVAGSEGSNCIKKENKNTKNGQTGEINCSSEVNPDSDLLKQSLVERTYVENDANEVQKIEDLDNDKKPSRTSNNDDNIIANEEEQTNEGKQNELDGCLKIGSNDEERREKNKTKNRDIIDNDEESKTTEQDYEYEEEEAVDDDGNTIYVKKKILKKKSKSSDNQESKEDFQFEKNKIKSNQAKLATELKNEQQTNIKEIEEEDNKEENISRRHSRRSSRKLESRGDDSDSSIPHVKIEMPDISPSQSRRSRRSRRSDVTDEVDDQEDQFIGTGLAVPIPEEPLPVATKMGSLPLFTPAGPVFPSLRKRHKRMKHHRKPTIDDDEQIIIMGSNMEIRDETTTEDDGAIGVSRRRRSSISETSYTEEFEEEEEEEIEKKYVGSLPMLGQDGNQANIDSYMLTAVDACKTHTYKSLTQKQIEDLTLFENLHGDKLNPLAGFLPKWRDLLSIDDENLPGHLQALKKEIQKFSEVRDKLKEEIKEMKPKKKLIRRYQFSRTKSFTIKGDEVPLFPKDYGNSSSTVQTDLTGETVNYQIQMVEKQKSQMEEAKNLEEQMTQVRRQVVKMESDIRDLEIEHLRNLTKKDELDDIITSIEPRIEKAESLSTQNVEQIKALKDQLQRVDNETSQQQEKLDKLASQAALLTNHLSEMLTFKKVLGAELEGIQNSEKPEVRKLKQDLVNVRTSLDALSSKVKVLGPAVEQKRVQVEEWLQNIDASEKAQEFNVKRRLEKWNHILNDKSKTFDDIQKFTVMNIGKKNNLLKSLKEKELTMIQAQQKQAALDAYMTTLEMIAKTAK